MSAITAMTSIAAYEDLHDRVQELQDLLSNDTSAESIQAQEELQEEAQVEGGVVTTAQNIDSQVDSQLQAKDDERLVSFDQVQDADDEDEVHSDFSESTPDQFLGMTGDFASGGASGAESAADPSQASPPDAAPLPYVNTGVEYRTASIDPKGERRREQRQRQRRWPRQR